MTLSRAGFAHAAMTEASEWLEAARRKKDPLEAALAQHVLGSAYALQLKVPEALTAYFEAAEFFRGHGDLGRYARILGQTASCLARGQANHRALELATDAQALAARLRVVRARYVAETALSIVYVNVRDFDKALFHLEEAQRFAHEDNDDVSKMMNAMYLGVLQYDMAVEHERAGQADAAERRAAAAHKLLMVGMEAAGFGYWRVVATAFSVVAGYAARAGDATFATELIEWFARAPAELRSTEQAFRFGAAQLLLDMLHGGKEVSAGFDALNKTYHEVPRHLRREFARVLGDSAKVKGSLALANHAYAAALVLDDEIQAQQAVSITSLARMRGELDQLRSAAQGTLDKLDDERRMRITLQRQVRILENAAHYDALTGLLNRRGLDEMVVDYWKNLDQAAPISVAYIDADGLKQINDQHGHAVGDTALKELARALKRAVRESDCLARYAGDEFVAVLPGTPFDTATVVSERLRATVMEIEPGSGTHPPLSVSIGFATLQQGERWEALLQRADVALYQAKREGRNRIRSASFGI